jgi:hypothetical protein
MPTILRDDGRLSSLRICAPQPRVHAYTTSVVECATGTHALSGHMLYALMLSQYRYGYERHVLAPSGGGTSAQAPPLMTPDHTTLARPAVLNKYNEYATVRPGQPLMHRNDVEIDYGQPTSPTADFNVDELLVHQRRRSSATSKEKEPLTPAQRRRKAQNRAAYVC